MLIAHGSRRTASNQEVQDLARKIEAIAGSQFDSVSSAFLEIAEPDIPTGIRRCIEAGATAITIVPYFLSAGRHVAEDIPREINKAVSEHADVKINCLPHIGANPSMPDFLISGVSG
jgi:sirohydrochlorin ferrochelatase